MDPLFPNAKCMEMQKRLVYTSCFFHKMFELSSWRQGVPIGSFENSKRPPVLHGWFTFSRNSEIRQNPHFVSHFALRVLACAKISNLFIVHFVHGTNLSNSLREFSFAYLDIKRNHPDGWFLFIGIAR